MKNKKKKRSTLISKIPLHRDGQTQYFDLYNFADCKYLSSWYTKMGAIEENYMCDYWTLFHLTHALNHGDHRF